MTILLLVEWCKLKEHKEVNDNALVGKSCNSGKRNPALLKVGDNCPYQQDRPVKE